jgi:ABC-type sugar transport system substrate-binding protein
LAQCCRRLRNGRSLPQIAGDDLGQRLLERKLLDLLDLIYGNSDSLTLPAATVIERAGKADDILLVSVDGTEPGLMGVKDGTLDSTILLAPQYSGFWKAWVPFRVAQGEDVGDEVLIQGVLVTPENVAPVIQLATDQVEQIEEFPFEQPLTEIVAGYLGEGTPVP